MERFEHGGNVYAHAGCVDFSASLNPLGMPNAARKALREGVDACAAYPDPACRELVAALARFEAVPPAWVVACAGATDAFARVCAVVRPHSALVCAPCYSGYEQALEQHGAHVVHHDLQEARNFEATPALAHALVTGMDAAFVANPNNPTGRLVRRDVLVAFLERARRVGATVVLDECFIDLTYHEGSNDLLGRYPNLVLVKAFTKTFCLAGLRLGYALCANEELARRLREMGQPWAVSVPAQLAGVACLQDADYLPRSRALVCRERERLRRVLGASGLRVMPSEANFLLFKGPQGLARRLLERHVLIRSCSNFRGLDECWYRIAVRTPEQNNLLAAALGEVLP